MGVTTAKITSGAFNNAHASFYRELQISNWTHVDLVITDIDGTQTNLLRESNIRESEASVEVLFRGTTGMRAKETKYGLEEVPVEGTKMTIPFDVIRNAPYKIPGLGIVISTVEHSYAASLLVGQRGYNIVYDETSVDAEIADPRFVFKIVDPNNRWSHLFVNVFGQTVVVRAGHYADELPVCNLFGSTESEQQQHESSKLTCYLRYPYKYYNGAPDVTTVFEVSLDSIDNEEPIAIPGGEYLCVADNMESLGRAIAKKNCSWQQKQPYTSQQNTVPKSVYESAQKQFKDEIDHLKQLHKQQIETITTDKDTQLSKLRSAIAAKDGEIATLTAKLGYCDTMFKTQATMHETEARRVAEQYKANKAWYEAQSTQDENFWSFIKIGSGLLVAAATVTAAVYAKSKK